MAHWVRDAVTKLAGTGCGDSKSTIADALLDPIVHNAYRIDLKAQSQRKRKKPPPLVGGNSK